jgi:hypothetical protein
VTGFPAAGAARKNERPGFPMTGRGRDGPFAADFGSDNRGNFDDSDDDVAAAERGFPTRGEFTAHILRPVDQPVASA